MTIQDQEFVEVAAPTGPMRVHRFYPKSTVARPAVILYSEIYQVTGPIRRLAGEGFEVLAPEVYHEYEEPGKVPAYDAAGTERGNFLKFEKPVAASACFYATDLHPAMLGQGKKDDALARAKESRVERLLLWNRSDSHVPLAGRKMIYDALTAAEANFQWHECNGAHAFARDEGLRYDAAASRLAFALALELSSGV